ncbi:MAG: dienelactone hydrolase family protein [Nitrospirae bacterium]|nr:dienelactone hydrolase family protein [Nitrospirota bacterium]
MKHLTKYILILLCGMVLACAQKSEMRSGPVEYKSDNVTLKGFLAVDNKIKGKRPGILVVHEWWGPGDFVRDRAKKLAEIGYTALAVDMYGDGKQAATQEEAAKYAKSVTEKPEVRKARFLAAMNLLKQQETVDPDKIAVIGYSFGGNIALEMARAGVDLKGVVTFYGGLSTNNPAQPGVVKAKILVCQGEKDWYVPVLYVTEFEQEMKKANVDYKLITYPVAEHGFSNPESTSIEQKFKMKVAYNAEADKKSWADMQEFFKTIFKK